MTTFSFRFLIQSRRRPCCDMKTVVSFGPGFINRLTHKDSGAAERKGSSCQRQVAAVCKQSSSLASLASAGQQEGDWTLFGEPLFAPFWRELRRFWFWFASSSYYEEFLPVILELVRSGKVRIVKTQLSWFPVI